MNKRSGFFAAIALIFILFSLALYVFLQKSVDLPFNLGVKKDPIPTITEGGIGEDIPAIWVWLKNTSITKENESYYLNGNIGGNHSKIKIYIGRETDEIAYARADDFTSFDRNFPERYPEWGFASIQDIQIDAENSNYAVVKLYTNTVSITEECDEQCNNFITRQIELVENNKILLDANRINDVDDMEVGPVVQLIQVLKK